MLVKMGEYHDIIRSVSELWCKNHSFFCNVSNLVFENEDVYFSEWTSEDLQNWFNTHCFNDQYKFGDDLRLFPYFQNGNQLCWTINRDNLEYQVIGEFHLRDVAKCLSETTSYLIFNGYTEKVKAILNESYIINDQYNYGNGRLTLIRIIDQGSSHEIYYYRDGELLQLRINYLEYIKITYLLLGQLDWQLFYADFSTLKWAYPEDYENPMYEFIEKLNFLGQFDIRNKFVSLLELYKSQWLTK